VRDCARALITSGPAAFDVEYRMRHQDGHWVWIHDRAQVQARGADGGVRRVVGFILDVSESHADREALRVSEERFRHATEAVRGVIYDLDYRTSQVTRFGTESLIGLTSAEIGLKRGDWIARIHPDDAPRFVALRREPCAPGDTQEIVYRIRHRDGHWLYAWDRAITVTAADGKPLRRIGFVQDVTSQYRRRLALQAESAALARLDVGVAVIDATLKLCSANAVFEARFGASAGSLVDRDLRALLAVDEAQWLRICDEMSAVGDSTDTACELPCRHRDGSTFHCQLLLRAQYVDGARQIVMTLQAPAAAAQH